MGVTLDLHADTEYLDHYLTRPGAPESLVKTWRMLAQRYGIETRRCCRSKS